MSASSSVEVGQKFATFEDAKAAVLDRCVHGFHPVRTDKSE